MGARTVCRRTHCKCNAASTRTQFSPSISPVAMPRSATVTGGTFWRCHGPRCHSLRVWWRLRPTRTYGLRVVPRTSRFLDTQACRDLRTETHERQSHVRWARQLPQDALMMDRVRASELECDFQRLRDDDCDHVPHACAGQDPETFRSHGDDKHADREDDAPGHADQPGNCRNACCTRARAPALARARSSAVTKVRVRETIVTIHLLRRLIEGAPSHLDAHTNLSTACPVHTPETAMVE